MAWRDDNPVKYRSGVKKNAELRAAHIMAAKGNLCHDCKQRFPFYMLEFDHRNPKEKKFCVSQGTHKSWQQINEEIAKCDVVCANCHKIRTFNRKKREVDMLIVEISVNTELIARETAVRIEGTTDPKSRNKYRLSNGMIIEHVYGDGAAVLAQKMLKHLKKKGV